MTESPVNYRRSLRRRLTTAIDSLVKDLNEFESNSPKLVNRAMTATYKKINNLSENIKKQDLNPSTFEAKLNYQQTKDKIKAYIENKYNKASLKDDNRIVEILQNRQLTSNYQQSTKMLFDSLNEHQMQDLLTNNKRKFGETWHIGPRSESLKPYKNELPEIKKNHTSVQKNPRLSALITKLMVKNLGIKAFGKPELFPQKKFTKIGCKPEKRTSSSMVQKKNEDEIFLNDNGDYLGPEYFSYISDIGNKLKIQRYIGKGSVKKRRNEKIFAKLSRL